MISEKKFERGPINEDEILTEEQEDEEKLSELGLSHKDIEELKSLEHVGASATVDFIEKNGQKMVVKRGSRIDPYEDSRREYAALRLLKMRKGKKIAPDPYYYNENEDMVIMEQIEGEPILKLSASDITDIARILGTVHKPEFNKPGIPFHERRDANQYDRLIEQVDFLNNWFNEIGRYIAEEELNLNEDVFSIFTKAKDIILERSRSSREDFQESSFSLIHYDLNPNNILKDKNGEIFFIDWRQASIADRAMDIAKFFYKNYLTEDQKEIFYQSYLKEINDETLKQRVETYYPLIRLGSILWRLRFLHIDSIKHPDLLKHVDIDLVKQRLRDDFGYIISSAGLNINEK